jgi:dipeptidyl aminopeptidase/acylaminoacyl peptidase
MLFSASTLSSKSMWRGLAFGLLVVASFSFAAPAALAQRQASVTARDLASLADLGGLSVSPDACCAAIQVRRANPQTNSYQAEWLVINLSTGAVRSIADAGESLQPTNGGRVNGFILAQPPQWSWDGSWLTYVRRHDGENQVWRVDTHSGRTEQLTRGDYDASAARYAIDGRKLYFMAEPNVEVALAGEGLGGFLYDQRFFPAYSTLPLQPRAQQGSANGSQLWILDIQSSQQRRANDAEQREYAVLLQPHSPPGSSKVRGELASSRSGRLAWTEARDPQLQGRYAPVTIVAQPVSGGAPIACTHNLCTGQIMRDLWWRGEDTIIFARGEGPSYQDTALYSWTIGDSSVRLILRTPGRLTSASNYEWRCAVASDKLICLFETPTTPRRLVSIDLDDGNIATLFDPNPAFADFDLIAQRIEIKTASGVETYGYLTLPPQARNASRFPLIIATYRCDGFLRGGAGDEYPIFPLASEGFAVLCLNAPDADYGRLASEDISTYQRWAFGPGDPEKRRVQEAIDAAISQLASRQIVDPRRVAVTGLSFGASTVGYALFNMPDLVAAIASGPPGSSPADFFLSGPLARESSKNYGFSAYNIAPDRWRSLALSENAGRVQAPLLINAADREMLSALESVTALEEHGRVVEMFVYPNEYHIKWQPAHRLAIYERNIDWLNFWLRGVESHLRDDPTQYERWRAMRGIQCQNAANGSQPEGASLPWYCAIDTALARYPTASPSSQ